MIFECCNCYRKFDADQEPEKCPYCKRKTTYGYITIINNRTGREYTWKEHIDKIRTRYLQNPPEGFSKREIQGMDDYQIEELDEAMDPL